MQRQLLFAGLVGMTILTLVALMKSSKHNDAIPILRMATNLKGSVFELDPASITNITQYELLRNLYGTLLTYDSHDNLVAGVADSFDLKQDRVIFHFGNRAITHGGHVIDARDAAFSLKRAILRKNTGHGDLRNFLCPGFELQSIFDACPGIDVVGNSLVLKPSDPNQLSPLIAMLESVDFSILPLTSMSADPTNPKILNYRETSGAYFVATDSNSGSWLLHANEANFRYSKQMPKQIQLVPAADAEATQLLKDGTIDFVPTFVLPTGGTALEIYGDRAKYNVYESMPICVYMLCFTPNAVKTFSQSQRLYTARAISSFVLSFLNKPGLKPTAEFFQSLSDGSLTNKQRSTVQALHSDISKPHFDHPIKTQVLSTTAPHMKSYLAKYPEIQVLIGDVSPALLPLEERSDVYFAFNDSAWRESLPLLGFNLSQGIFHLPGLDGEKWLKDYASTSNREERITKLNNLHYELLRTVVIYPFAVSPYVAFANKQWELVFSTFSAGTELWNIKFVN